MIHTYKTRPDDVTHMPSGIPYIVGNEAAERFSFYGMKSILIVFMTKHLMDHAGVTDVMSPEEAKVWYHSFNTWVYLFPLAGALLADLILGKYRTILWLSIVYCAGHAMLAIDETRNGLFWGLALIAVGSGGIKPCVSAHVGDQFGKSNADLLEKVFGWFYFSINLGAFTSTLLTPILLVSYGPAVAFGIPGILMGIATLVFWLGRTKFIHIPARPKEIIAELKTPAARSALLQLPILYLFVAMFWALFDQTGSAWVLQAGEMDRDFLGMQWLTSQVQAVNPIMILVFIPVFSLFIYPRINRIFTLTPMRKISIGLFLTVPAFLLPAWIQYRIESGEIVNIVWQLASYVIITAAEVLVSITCLEFSYTQAPKQLKSIIMALFLVSVSAGNLFVAGVNIFIQDPGPTVKLEEPGIYSVKLEVNDGINTAENTISLHLVNEIDKGQHGNLSSSQQPSLSLGRVTSVQPGKSINIFANSDPGDAKGETQYLWRVVSKPSESSKPRLSYDGGLYNTLTTDEQGEYIVELSYRVGSESVVAQQRIVATTTNLSPLFEKHADLVQRVYTQEEIPLDFLMAFDPDGDALRYKWSLTTKNGEAIDVINLNSGRAGSTLTDTEYYLFFAAMMFLTAIGFVPFARRYKGTTYLQD